ncbi:protein kinase [Streptomyces sp. NPDC047022]|uniref:serine/threonine-protein kinase n=1 Tax=Streptomyces sp. NPDC047022 TaxID=3155737 RepID=UPI0033F53B06
MGEVFAGRYELVDPIGRGGVGAVWRAWDHRRRRYVAAKVLQQSDAHTLLRFVREQALRIDHPHVLAPASWAADDDKVLFTMDLVAGGSLVHLVQDYGPLPPAVVCTLLDQLLSGLAAVHAERVVHRDIKPANVLLDATGTARPRLRLSDFGIAMRLGEPRLTETDYVVGTPGYLAPEQLMGSDPDFTADLFGVGLVALYLLQGAKPDTKALVEYFTANGTPGAPLGVPEPLWEVVATLLQPDPAARFRSATGARKALAAARELLPEPEDDVEQVEIFDQLGPLPEGFGPGGPLRTPPSVTGTVADGAGAGAGAGTSSGTRTPAGGTAGRTGGTGTGSGPLRPSTGLIPPPPTTAPAASGTTAPSEPSALSAPGTNGSAVPGPVAVPPDSAASAHPTPPTHRPPSAPLVVPPRPASDPTPPPRSPGMSDTGSFHLPPPLPLPREPQGPPASPVLPAPAHALPVQAPHLARTSMPATGQTAVPALAVRQSAQTYADVSPHTPPRPRETVRHARRPARRPGPPAKVAVPVLLLALLCFAVGFWALARI